MAHYPIDFVVYHKSGIIKHITTCKNDIHLRFVLLYSRSEKARWALIRHDNVIIAQSKTANPTSRLGA